MGWLWRERRGPAWKQGWAEHTITSISPPPFPLLAIFVIIIVLLSLSSYFNYKYQMQHSVINFKLIMLFLPVLMIFIAKLVSKGDRFFFYTTKAEYGTLRRNWDLPWGVGILVVILLVMLSYQSSFGPCGLRLCGDRISIYYFSLLIYVKGCLKEFTLVHA